MPDALQPVFTLPPINEIPDDIDDQPEPGPPLPAIGSLSLPALAFGAASLSHHYNTDEHLVSTIPIRTVRIALRYGIRFFDTSPFYGSSEVVLGRALKTLQNEFPRSSYKLVCYSPVYGELQSSALFCR